MLLRAARHDNALDGSSGPALARARWAGQPRSHARRPPQQEEEKGIRTHNPLEGIQWFLKPEFGLAGSMYHCFFNEIRIGALGVCIGVEVPGGEASEGRNTTEAPWNQQLQEQSCHTSE